MQIIPRLRHHLRFRPAVPLTALIAVAAVLTGGCGAAAGPSTPTTTGAGPPQNDIADAFKYSSCMREHGVSNFPDPTTSSRDGHQSVIIAVHTSASSPAFKSAATACQGILPMPTKADLLAQAQQQRVHAADLLSFARCLRSHGVTSFPDPNAQGELNAQTVSAAGVDIHAPAFQATARTCLPAAHGGITAADLQRAESSAP